MIQQTRIFLLAVLFGIPVLQLHAWQGKSSPSPMERQVNLDEFAAAVARCEKQVEKIGDGGQRSLIFLELAKIHYRLKRTDEAARYLESVDRSDLNPNTGEDDFDYLQQVFEHGVSGWLESLDSSALKWAGNANMRDSVYLDAIGRCPIELGQPLVSKLVTDGMISWAYSGFAMKEIRNGNEEQADGFVEKWFTHAKAAYMGSGSGGGGRSHGYLLSLPGALVRHEDVSAIKRAQHLSRRVLEFAEQEDELQAFWAAAILAGRSGMPTLVKKANQRIDELAGKNTGGMKRQYSNAYHLAMAYARLGNHKLAVKYFDDCGEPDDFVLLEAIVHAMVRDKRTELAFEFASEFGDVGDSITMHLEIAKVAGKLGLQSTVKRSLAKCRELASMNTEHISQNENTRIWYFERIARTHFRLGEFTACNEWSARFSDDRFKARAMLAEVEWRSTQIEE